MLILLFFLMLFFIPISIQKWNDFSLPYISLLPHLTFLLSFIGKPTRIYVISESLILFLPFLFMCPCQTFTQLLATTRNGPCWGSNDPYVAFFTDQSQSSSILNYQHHLIKFVTPTSLNTFSLGLMSWILSSKNSCPPGILECDLV